MRPKRPPRLSNRPLTSGLWACKADIACNGKNCAEISAIKELRHKTMITDYILMFGLKILPNNLSDVRLAGMVELELMESQQIIINNNQEPVFLLCQQDQTSAVMQIMIPVHTDRPPPTPSCASCAIVHVLLHRVHVK